MFAILIYYIIHRSSANVSIYYAEETIDLLILHFNDESVKLSKNLCQIFRFKCQIRN